MHAKLKLLLFLERRIDFLFSIFYWFIIDIRFDRRLHREPSIFFGDWSCRAFCFSIYCHATKYVLHNKHEFLILSVFVYNHPCQFLTVLSLILKLASNIHLKYRVTDWTRKIPHSLMNFLWLASKGTWKLLLKWVSIKPSFILSYY